MTAGAPGSPEDPDPGLDPELLRRRREIVATFAALILILGAMGGVAYYFLHPAPVDLHEIVDVAKKTVALQVGPEFRCAFPFFDEFHIDTVDGEHYVVHGWVEMIDRDGRTSSALFTCSVIRAGSRKWVPEKVEIVR